MARVLITGIVLAVILTVYTVVDCAMTDARRTKMFQKPVWLVVILLLPVIGPLMWIFAGKQSREAAAPPDENAVFLEGLGSDPKHDARILELEAEMRALDAEIEQARQDSMRQHPSNHTGANPIVHPDGETAHETDEDDSEDHDERNGRDGRSAS